MHLSRSARAPPPTSPNEFQKRQIPVRALTAPLRPLNNVTTAAIAVEVAPQGSDLMQLTAPDYQQLVTSAVATAIAADSRPTGSPAMIPRHLIIGVTVLLVAVLGMSIYAWHMRGRVAAIAGPSTPSAADTRALAPTFAGPTERATSLRRLRRRRHPAPALRADSPARGRQQRAEELLRALLTIYLDKSSPHVLAPGADVRSVFLVDPGVAVIDLNSAFADGHRSGVLVEDLTVTSLIHTISANTPGVLKVKILVDGKERETLAGHADLSGFYDVTAVNQLSTQLQPVQ